MTKSNPNKEKVMTANTISWNSVRDRILANPEVKAEYDSLKAKFSIARAVITLSLDVFHNC
jgi:hypothetical protein